MRDTFIITTRNLENGSFGTKPGTSQFIAVDASKEFYSKDDILERDKWRLRVADAADGEEDKLTKLRGDILFFVHGYCNDIPIVLWRTRTLQSTLRDQGWKGVVVGFDWPSDNSTLNYIQDREKSSEVALYLVNESLSMLVGAENRSGSNGGCKLNIHLIGHSTGAYVIMEAFNQAEKNGKYYQSNWRIGQVAFVGGDVSSDSLRLSSDWAVSMFKRIMRFTNYSNGCDRVLAVSNAKRMGAAPRVGRVGLPAEIDRKAINVDCTKYFMTKDPSASTFQGTFCHSWHIGDPKFALDLAMTLEGGIDRMKLPTRAIGPDGLELREEGGGRPEYQALWDAEQP